MAAIVLFAGCATPIGHAGAHGLAGGAKAMLTLGEQDNGRRVPARVGDVVEVKLPENATTGYRWALDSQDGGVIQAQDTAADYPSAAVGSGGAAIFRFKVVGAGSANLALKSWRHWEGDKSVVQRFAVTIDAAP